jgi:hypothetical protein
MRQSLTTYRAEEFNPHRHPGANALADATETLAWLMFGAR